MIHIANIFSLFLINQILFRVMICCTTKAKAQDENKVVKRNSKLLIVISEMYFLGILWGSK